MNATVEAITLLYRGLPKKARREVVEALLADTDLAEDLMDVGRIVATRGEKTCSSAQLRAAVRTPSGPSTVRENRVPYRRAPVPPRGRGRGRRSRA